MANPFNQPPGERPTDTDPEPPASEPEPAPVEASREVESVPSSMWTVAGYLVLLLLLGLGGYELYQQKLANDRLLEELARTEATADEAAERNRNRDREIAAAEAELQALRDETERLQREKDQVRDAQEELELEMRAALATKDITISELEGKLTLSILDRILFDSGKAIIKPEGEEVLRKIATVLDQFPGRQIHVTGHTDNVPIRTSQFPSNWELSAARALAAVRFLVEQAGTDPKRLAAVANGEFQPIADNATAEGRASNRRIAIVVLPEVFRLPQPPAEPPPAAPEPVEESPGPAAEPDAPDAP